MSTPNLNAYPGINRALVAIAYDNGMVNREQSEWMALYDMFLAVTKKYTTLQIADVNRQLAVLTDEQLDEVCCGGREGDDTNPPPGIDQLADDMLNWAFDPDPEALDVTAAKETTQ